MPALRAPYPTPHFFTFAVTATRPIESRDVIVFPKKVLLPVTFPDESRLVAESEDAADAFPLIHPFGYLKVVEVPVIQFVLGIPKREAEPETVLRYQPIIPPLAFQAKEFGESNHASLLRSLLNWSTLSPLFVRNAQIVGVPVVSLLGSRAALTRLQRSLSPWLYLHPRIGVCVQ